MAWRVTLPATGESFEAGPAEPLLAAAARAGVRLPHDCTLGNCGTCRVRVLEGRVAYEAMPLAITPEESAAGYALACQARAATDLAIEVPQADLTEPQRLEAMVTEVEPWGESVTHLVMVLPELERFEFRPGQHLHLHLPDGTHRSFSMASPPSGNQVDLHVRRIPGGRFTESVLPGIAPGDLIEVELPLGAFRYHPEDDREIVMAATGTGLAPLKAIVESLAADRFRPPIALYWGGRTAADLYLDATLREWAGTLVDFRYVPVLSRAGFDWPGRRGYVQQAVAEDFPDLSEHAVYLCGSPTMIRDAKAAFAARGAALERLYSDGFSFQARPD